MTRSPGGLRAIRTRSELAGTLDELRAGGRSVGFVPTMGFLHDGHLSLVARARQGTDVVALSIFVNPLQFGPGEDLDRYPRDLDHDLALAAGAGVDVVFAPSREEMFPDGPPEVRVVPGALGARLCGAFRPGHFEGVLTIVARLFGLVRPDMAVFGRKDFQQAVLIRRMVDDLALGVEIHVAPLLREADGLAMSSRNAFLSAEERAAAPTLFRALDGAERAFRAGEHNGARLGARVMDVLTATPGFRPEYAELVHPGSLEAVREARAGDVLAAATFLGETRLIDNVVLGAATPDPRVGDRESR